MSMNTSMVWEMGDEGWKTCILDWEICMYRYLRSTYRIYINLDVMIFAVYNLSLKLTSEAFSSFLGSEK